MAGPSSSCPPVAGRHPRAAVLIISGAREAARCRWGGTERPPSTEFIVVAGAVGLDVRLEMNCSGVRTQATNLWFNLFIAQEGWALSCQLTMASFQTEERDCQAACHRLPYAGTPPSQGTAFKSVWQFSLSFSKSGVSGMGVNLIWIRTWPDQHFDMFSWVLDTPTDEPSRRRGLEVFLEKLSESDPNETIKQNHPHAKAGWVLVFVTLN